MAEHTPGPWHADLGERSLYHAHCRRLILARESDGSTVTLAKLPESYGGDYEAAAANARLMAASPDLLSALKSAAAAINPSDRNGISLCEWNDRLRAATVTVNAAIAKAESREATHGAS